MKRSLTFSLVLAGAAVPLLLALAPGWLPPGLGHAVRHGLSPFCHQLAERSPHVSGVQLGLCWRCLGVAGGLVLGTALWPGLRGAWARWARPWALVVGAVVALDWGLGAVGVWADPWWARFTTGALGGAVLGLALAQAGMERPSPSVA